MSESALRYTVASLAKKIGGTVIGDDELLIHGVNGAAAAGPTEITFVSVRKYVRDLLASKAGAALVSADVAEALRGKDSRPLIVVPDPGLAQGRVLQLYSRPEPLPEPGVHPAAVVDSTVLLGRDVRVGLADHVVVGKGARVAGASVVFKDVPPGATWLGYPADDMGAVKRQWASLKRLPD